MRRSCLADRFRRCLRIYIYLATTPTDHSCATVLISTRPRFVISNVVAVLELPEEVRQKWMLDRQTARIGDEIFRCGIGAGQRSVDEYVVPRLIAVRLCLVLGIPLVVGLAELIAVNDDSSIAVAAMANQLSGFEDRLCGTADCNHCSRKFQSRN